MNPLTDKELFHEPKLLPNIDWTISFFGGHTQIINEKWIIEPDRHQAFEILYIIEGEEYINIEGQTYKLKSGDIFLIPPNFSHQVWINKIGTEYFSAHFDITEPNFSLNLIAHSAFFYPTTTKENEKLRTPVNKLINLVDHDSYDFRTKIHIQIILSELLLEIHELISDIKNSPELDYGSIKLAKKISLAILEAFNECKHNEDYFNEKSVCNIHTSEIIRTFGITPEYGYEVFKKNFGVSPRNFLTELILKESQKLLQKPELTINEISRILGYSSSAHFSRQFKRWTKFSPREFRKKYYSVNFPSS